MNAEHSLYDRMVPGYIYFVAGNLLVSAAAAAFLGAKLLKWVLSTYSIGGYAYRKAREL